MVKKLLIGIAILAAALGGGLAYAWNRATAVPQWYATEPTLPNASVSVPELLTQRSTQSGEQVQVTLTEADLNQIATSATENSAIAPVLEATRGISTRLEGDRIESGTVLNLSELPLEQLPAQGQTAVSQLQDRFPMLAEQDVYVGLSGHPQVVDGQLQLGEEAMLQIGRMSIPLRDVAQQLGLSQTELEAQLSNLLTQQGMTLDSLQIVDGQLQLQGSRGN